ncbi:carbohydrate esterase family 8 protein [Pseudovirgaria hyperparasitica]|uniref:Pectinesterase n=1 Tax=Pseudovirgaria hyperparasitica TaxID=470096 RepID=A0A6A6WD66_9PEZI|nr:carbohydrate esterase family 8 protein [Pseudovirgaria hyperparasitica]KAF2760768.1 carbohydrate esterase family 8 protein [Pseudovirgaria hyperparasitica]
MKLLAALSALLTLTHAASRTEPPAGALVVGGSGSYSKIQDAVNALSTTSTTAQSIFINPGTYKEQVYIPARKAALTIYGYTSNTAAYSSNQVTITQGKSQDDSANNDLTATVRAWSTNFKMYNINMVNTRGKGSQALAISAQADKQGYYACQFKGFQDTVLSQTGAQVFAKSYIEGATDFIFGQHASTWFDGVTIGVLSASVGYITASGRSSSSDANYYVINKSTVQAASGNTVTAGAYYLGRPWGNYARVVFQNTALSAVINSAGWKIWNTGDERTDHVTFAEYGNTGAGASGTRASFSSKLSAPVAITTILGSGYTSWVDTSYLS